MEKTIGTMERMTLRACPCQDEADQIEPEKGLRCSYCGKFSPMRTFEFNPDLKNSEGEYGAWVPVK